MNTDKYKQRLLAMKEGLSSRMKRAGATAREPLDDSTSDAGDESANNEQKEEQLWKVDTDRTMLSQVQNALDRIETGTFGKCLVDGEPIDVYSIIERTSLPAQLVIRELTFLTLKGQVRRVDGQKYAKR